MKVEMPLRARDLTRVYRSPLARRRIVALDRLDFDLEPGMVLGLVGPNGSGKTTTIRCCLGLLAPSRGEVRIFGAPAGSLAARQRVGYAPERFELSEKRSGRETLRLLAAFGEADRSGELLERLELSAAADRRLGTWSKGMRRRLAIAAALLDRPRLLVMDEPFDGLDPLGNRVVRQEIQSRAEQGAAVLVSSHALSDLEAVATHLLVLSSGRTVARGSVDEVLARPDRLALEVTGADMETLREAVKTAGGEIVSGGPSRESLEDLFLRQVDGDER